MSLVKKSSQVPQPGGKKCMNLTAQVSEAIASYNKKGAWNNKTCKLIKTLANQGPSPKNQAMTEDDIDKLFSKNIKTEESPKMLHRDFISPVKFLKINDEFDKFLTGIPRISNDENYMHLRFKKEKSFVEDLTT